MASGGHGQVEPDRLDPAKLAPFPKALDINSDILIPQFSDKWMMELKAALGSRFQFEVLEEADPTLDQIFEWYEDTGYSNEQLTTFYDAILQKRHEKRRLATLNLLAAIKDESLTMMQREKLLKFGDMHDAVSIYKFICEVCDLSAGLSQDKIRAKYAKVKIAATDSASTIIKQIELKWWLLRKHTNYGLASAPAVNECPAKYGMCMVCSSVPFRSREHDENTLRTAHPAVIFASHMCLVCGWVWVLDMNTRQQYMKPFYTGTLDINRSQTVPDPGTIGAVPDSIISTNTIHAHHPAYKVLQLHLPCTNPAIMQMECIVKT